MNTEYTSFNEYHDRTQQDQIKAPLLHTYSMVLTTWKTWRAGRRCLPYLHDTALRHIDRD